MPLQPTNVPLHFSVLFTPDRANPVPISVSLKPQLWQGKIAFYEHRMCNIHRSVHVIEIIVHKVKQEESPIQGSTYLLLYAFSQ